MSLAPTVTLNDGRQMPQLGLGVWRMPDDAAGGLVCAAIGACYRLIDTAAIYGNERGVGEGIRRCDVDRSELFITTKCWNDRQGYDNALKAFDRSLERLGLDYVDLYLIHWPAPDKGLYVETWKAFARLRDEGRARSIGVSNFMPEHLERLVGETGVVPAVNQIEVHPEFQQTAARAAGERLGIVNEAWSPLGQGRTLQHAAIAAMARKYGRSPAQIILRWHVQQGLVAIPKSSSPERMAQNLDVFGFQLDAEDMALLSRMDSPAGRVGPDPMSFS